MPDVLLNQTTRLPHTLEGVLLAFDYGEVRIGVAVGNTVTRQASALAILPNTTVAARFSSIANLIKLWQPMALVVGLPRYSDGTPHKMTQRATRFGNQLHGRFCLPIHWVDERYSTTEARTTKKVRAGATIDDEAARIILQQFFDTNEQLPQLGNLT